MAMTDRPDDRRRPRARALWLAGGAVAMVLVAATGLAAQAGEVPGKIVTFVDKPAAPALSTGALPERANPDDRPGRGEPAGRATPTTAAATPAPPANAPTPTAAPPATAPPAPPPAPPPPPPAATRCVVRLHGKGASGEGTTTVQGSVVVSPTGNSAAWGGMQWLYFPDASYQQARAIVASAISNAGCTHAVVHGFSNGGAFAAKLYCRGETFGGKVVGYVADDPVTDHAVEGCAPARGVRIALYWTGALASTATPGWNCASADWTCDGGTTIGIDAYQQALGTASKASPVGSHAPYYDAPEDWSW